MAGSEGRQDKFGQGTNPTGQNITRVFIENAPWINATTLQHVSVGGDNATNNTIVSATFAVLPQKPVHLAITSGGGTWFIFASMPRTIAANPGSLIISFAIDGVEVTGKFDGLGISVSGAQNPYNIFWIQQLSVGAHTIDIVAQMQTGTGIIYCDTTAQINLWAMEITAK